MGAAGVLHTNKGQNLITERRVSADEMERKTKEYQYFVLKDIFSEYELKNYLNEIKNIIQKNTKCSKEVFAEDFYWENDNGWFGTNGKNFYYFLDEDNNSKEDIKGEYNLKKQSCLNIGNSERIYPKCEVFK